MKNREIAEWLRQQANALHMPALMLEDGIEDNSGSINSIKDASDAISEMQKTLEDKAKELEAFANAEDDEEEEYKKSLTVRERHHCKALAKRLLMAFPWGSVEYPDMSNINGNASKWDRLHEYLIDLGDENE